MTRFTKTKIALATAGVLLSGASSTVSAMNGTFNNGAVPPVTQIEPAFASNLLGLPAATVANVNPFSINAVVPDDFFGRLQAFTLRISLTGAQWASPAPIVGSGITPFASIGAPAVATDDWTLGALGFSGGVLSVPVLPGITNFGIPAGELIQFPAGSMIVDTVTASLGTGGTVSMTVDFLDPVGGTVLETFTQVIYTASEATTSLVSTGDGVSRIDVGSTGGVSGADASKTFMAPLGTINENPHVLFFRTGHLNVGLAAGGRSAAGATNAAGWDSNGLDPATGTFQYNVAADTVTATVEGSDFSSVNGIWLAPNADDCSNSGLALSNVVTQLTTPAVDASGTAVTAPITGTAGNDFEICMSFDGTTQIEDQALKATASINLDPGAVVTSGLLIDPTDSMNDTSPLQFNGDVVEIQFVNSQNNVTQRSRVRLSNTGGTNGIVTFTGIDDDGTASTGSSSLTLLAGESVIVKIGDIEDGTGNVTSGAMGTPPKGSGKWRLTITAEFDGMEVTNFLRHDGNIVVDMTKTTVQ